jgi:hypothetical protein
LKEKRSAGALDFFAFGVRPLRTNWLMVGISASPLAIGSNGGGWPRDPGRSNLLAEFWARKQAEKPVREQRPGAFHGGAGTVFKHSASRPGELTQSWPVK